MKSKCLLANGRFLVFLITLSFTCHRLNAKEPLNFYLHGSLVVGNDESAQAGVDEFLQSLGRETNLDFVSQIGKSSGLGELNSLGKDLSSGRVHFAAIEGLEYGWLLHNGYKIEPLIVTEVGDGVGIFYVLFAAREVVSSVADLPKPAKLAIYERNTLGYLAFIRELNRDYGRDRFTLVEFATPFAAQRAVLTKRADCVVFGGRQINAERAVAPARLERLIELDKSLIQSIQPVVIVASKRVSSANIKRIQTAMILANNKESGRNIRRYFRFVRFAMPKPNLKRECSTAASQLPRELRDIRRVKAG